MNGAFRRFHMRFRRCRAVAAVAVVFVAAPTGALAQIRVNPTGVNVNTQGATTAFLTFGGLRDQIAVEALWCGELIPAAPDLGSKCDPSTLFGSLPIRLDRSQATGRAFTDIMSIPPSVSRRAYQAAEAGARSGFFYVRRFVRPAGGPDEYVAVTCRLAGGGARTPLALTDVRLAFSVDDPVLFVRTNAVAPPFAAAITFTGTGRLKGRWEIVRPGEELPTDQDLLTEAALPAEQRPFQRRYTEIGRFNEFLTPIGRAVLEGPDPTRLPTDSEGLYLVLLRIEASDDKEGDSNLEAAGAGSGIVHSGAVAGFPLPVLRYIVGGNASDTGTPRASTDFALLQPAANAAISGATGVFVWSGVRQAAMYRLEIQTIDGTPLVSALVPSGAASYHAPSWLRDRAPDGHARWRVLALNASGTVFRLSEWRGLRIE